MGDKIETLSFDRKPLVVRERKKRKKRKTLKETAVTHGRIITLPEVIKQHSGLNVIKRIVWILENDRLYVKFHGDRKEQS